MVSLNYASTFPAPISVAPSILDISIRKRTIDIILCFIVAMQPRSNIMSIPRHVLLIHCPFYRPRDLEFVRNSFAVTMSIPTPSILSLLRDPAFFQGQRILNTVSTCPPRSQIARITILSPPYRGDLNATRVFRPPIFLPLSPCLNFSHRRSSIIRRY